jgi:small nuclear ribonucleoprotein (snRNP)-like protein
VSRALKERLKSRVIVTLKAGDSFDGVLWSVDRDVWVLRNATALQAGPRGANVGLDGEVVLLVSEISYAQRP